MATKKPTTTQGTSLAVVNEAPGAIDFLQERLKQLTKTVETPYKTGGKVTTSTMGTINIAEEKDVEKLVAAHAAINARAEAIQKSYDMLGIKEHKMVKVEGYTVADWTHDIKLKIQIANEDKERKELEGLVEEAKQFITREQQEKMFMDKLKKKFVGEETTEA